MTDPFLNPSHCTKVATRQAIRTGVVVPVIATRLPAAPLAVIDHHRWFELGAQVTLSDLLFTAYPFADVSAN